jgi:hypothetical protein
MHNGDVNIYVSPIATSFIRDRKDYLIDYNWPESYKSIIGELDTHALARIQNETGGQIPMDKFTLNTAINALRNLRNETITTQKIYKELQRHQRHGDMNNSGRSMHHFRLQHLFHTDTIRKGTQTVPPTSIQTTISQIHTSTSNQEQHTNHNHLTTKEKHSRKNTKQHHGLGRRPL